MNRVWAGIGLLATAGFASALIATPSGADDKPEPKGVQLDATWTPNPAGPGVEVTLTPDSPCVFDIDRDNPENVSTAGVVLVQFDANGDGDISEDEVSEVPMNEDGTWTFTTKAPTTAGVYNAAAECQTSTFKEELGWCGLDKEDVEPTLTDEGFKLVSYSVPTWHSFNCEFEFYSADLTVEVPGEETTTTVPETTPPPAVAIPETPPLTG